MENIVNRMEDRDGLWELDSNGVTWSLVTPSDSFLEEQGKEPVVSALEPTTEEYLMDLDLRLSLIELNL